MAVDMGAVMDAASSLVIVATPMAGVCKSRIQVLCLLFVRAVHNDIDSAFERLREQLQKTKL